jgi:hypothetical protein
MSREFNLEPQRECFFSDDGVNEKSTTTFPTEYAIALQT